MSYEIDPETIDPTGIYIKAELVPLKPTDDMAKWNAGQIANQVGLPKEYILEDAGIEDPQEALKIWEGEKIDEQLLKEWIQKRDLAIQMEAQQVQMQQQMEAQQAQMQQQQQAQDMAQAQQVQGGETGGPGFNTGQGGTPGIQANPPETQLREQLQDRTRTGEPLV